MNQTYLDLLNQTMLNEMANDINKKLNEENKEEIEATPESVFKNLPMLYDTMQEKAFGEPTGNSYRYMPKRYKAMVMRLIAPEYYPDVKITYVYDDNKTPIGVCAEARLYLNNEDSRPVAFGKQYLSYKSVSEQIEDERELHAYVEATVRGIALSKAYQEFGIGSWYTYQFEPEENPDAKLAAMENKDGVIPIIAYGDDESQKTINSENTTIPVANEPKSQESPKQEKEPQPQAGTNVDSDAPADETPEEDPAEKTSDKAATKDKEKKTAKLSKGGMTLEKARGIKAPIGKAADRNLTLGETEIKYPINILWMYTQQNISSEVKEALIVISLNNPKILDAFTEKGINIGQM